MYASHLVFLPQRTAGIKLLFLCHLMLQRMVKAYHDPHALTSMNSVPHRTRGPAQCGDDRLRRRVSSGYGNVLRQQLVVDIVVIAQR